MIDQSFDFSRVNILIGENSSGKSSLIKFLMLLTRSERLTNTNFRYTSELGKFKDFIRDQNTDLDLTFSFTYGKEYVDFFEDNVGDTEDWSNVLNTIANLSLEEQEIVLTYSFDKNVQRTNVVKTTIENKRFGKLEIERDSEEVESVMKGSICRLIYYPIEGDEVTLERLSFDQHGFFTILHGIGLEKAIEENEKVDNSIFFEIGFLLIAQNYTRDLLKRTNYLNPIESTPERVYEENEQQGVLYPVSNIQDVVNILSDETLDVDVQQTLLESLNLALRRYGILHEIKAVSSDFSAKELKVKVKEGDIWCNIKDVGYGSSLQIPIIFQSIVGEWLGGETIIIEQPEIHIHPFLQSKFIETLLSLGNTNQYIIETHSSDIIRKLQVMVKKEEEQLEEQSVNIYYFRKKDGVTSISTHIINEYGKLSPKFPSGFYDSSVNLVKELF